MTIENILPMRRQKEVFRKISTFSRRVLSPEKNEIEKTSDSIFAFLVTMKRIQNNEKL